MWSVEVTDQFVAWYQGLQAKEADAVEAVVGLLEERGPDLGRPWADRIHASRYHHMKELRPKATDIRILFAFDPLRCAILLLGGDKQQQWNAWYDTQVPVADALYAEHLRELEQEGSL